MAVNGFLVDNEVQKYNYESLENYNTPDFSTSSIYQVGDYVMYQGKLYKCTTAITTSGGWDSSKWSLAILSDDVANLRSFIESGGYGLSESVKQALLQIVRKVTYVDDQGQIYYNTLYNALYPPVDLSSISAVYTQSGTVYGTDTLDSLKADLVVTAHYSDSSTQTVPAADYTLSGTLTAGTSTITVAYGGKTTTFSVIVTGWDYAWDYSMGYLTANGWTMGSETGSSVLQNDGLLLTSNRVFRKDSNPTCTTCVFETTFTLISFDSSTQSNRGYRLIIFNGNRAVTINVKETGLEAYNYTTKSYDIAAPVELNREYVLRVEAGQTTGKLYLDGELVLTVPLGTTTSTQSIVSQIGKDNGRQTLVKNIRYSFQS